MSPENSFNLSVHQNPKPGNKVRSREGGWTNFGKFKREKKVLLRGANKFSLSRETYTDMPSDELKHTSMYKPRIYGLING